MLHKIVILFNNNDDKTYNSNNENIIYKTQAISFALPAILMRTWLTNCETI